MPARSQALRREIVRRLDRSDTVSERRASGGLEAEVLATLWTADKPLTAGDVIDELDADLAYNTVQTILTRLHGKGAVTREQSGRAHAYTPVLDEAGLAAQRMQAMLDRGGDHAAVLSRFLGTLTEEDGTILAELIRQQDSSVDGDGHVARTATSPAPVEAVARRD